MRKPALPKSGPHAVVLGLKQGGIHIPSPVWESTSFSVEELVFGFRLDSGSTATATGGPSKRAQIQSNNASTRKPSQKKQYNQWLEIWALFLPPQVLLPRPLLGRYSNIFLSVWLLICLPGPEGFGYIGMRDEP